MGEDEPPELIGPEYAEVGKKEISGKEQWTLYTLSYDPTILATGSPYMPPIERVKYMAFWLADQTADKAAEELEKQDKEKKVTQTQAMIQEIKGKYGTISSEPFTSCLGINTQSYPGTAYGCISVKSAEAEREAKIALAQGEAESIRLVYEAQARGLEKLKEANINESVLKLKGLEALRDVADGNATKIYMPTEIAGIVSTLGVIGESLGIGDRTEISQKPKPDKSSEMDPCLKPTTSKEGVQSAKTLNQITSDLEERRKDVL